MSTELAPVEARARIHAALGDPGRLAIVDALVLGDASPGELGAALGMATNLVAHHLKVLQQVGLITRGPSEGDRRRTYVRVVPATLSLLVLPPQVPVRRIVFVCTHNSARSQLAAAMWRDKSEIPAASAGTTPADRVHPRAIRIGRRHGLALAGAGTAHVSDVVSAGDLVVAVCDVAHEQLAAARPGSLHWSVPDPSATNTDAAFEAAYSDIAARVDRLAPIVVQGELP